MADGIDKQQVLEQLERIVTSAGFTAGLRIKAFLRHVVIEELEGRGDRLKGTALAMDLYGRRADFDAASDPIVRTEAVKLRKALEHYYLTDGAGDGLHIMVPKGSYRPDIQRRASEVTAPRKPSPRPGLPLLIIAPFTGGVSQTAQIYRDGLPGELALELARFGHVRVRTDMSATNGPTGSSDYVLSGQVQEAGESIRIMVQLTRADAGEVIWSQRYRIDSSADDVFAMQETIARACTTHIADAYGILAQDVGARLVGRQREDAGVFEALLAFHAHMRTSRHHSLNEFSEIATLALRDNPDSGLAHALVTLSLIEGVAFGQLTMAELVASGRGPAEKAIALAPTCQEALFCAAALALMQGDKPRFATLCDRAVRANPNGALLNAMAGTWFAMAGDIDRGIALIDLAFADNPMLPVWLRVPVALGAIGRGDYDEASDIVRDLNVRDVTGEWLIIAAAHGLAADRDRSAHAYARLTDLCHDPIGYLSGLPIDGALSKALAKGLEEASHMASGLGQNSAH